MSGASASLEGNVLIAHPSKVAQADQRAAEHGVDRVALNKFCPPDTAYIVDLDYLTRLPEEGFGVV